MTDTRRVAIVVLGDLGRSPRMQYHALALAHDGAHVDLIGHEGHPPDDAVLAHPRIRIHLLKTPWRRRAPRALFVPVAAAGLLAESVTLARTLLQAIPRPDYILVQNPPAFPTLIVAALVAHYRAATLVVDWHNFGADLLALRLGRGHPVVRAARAAESWLGRHAHAHLCVSEAMRSMLAQDWGVASARVLRDRPAKHLGPTSPLERQRLFDQLGLGFDATARDRPAVIITASSWTDDEDFALLLDAMVRCDQTIRSRIDLPNLLFVLTGDGARRAHWEQRIAALGLSRVRVHTCWVAAADYPLLLGSADLGVSLHRSASGVDLPMKIADMFGAGLPVCALAYGPVMGELVKERENGLLFMTADDLARQICDLFAGFPDRTPALDDLARGVARLSTMGWIEGWNQEARGVFRSSSNG